MGDPRRGIPSVDRLLASAAFAPLLAELPRDLVVSRLQQEVALLRSALTADAHGGSGRDAGTAVDAAALAGRVRRAVQQLEAPSLVPVINATGVVLHTNLGRAPLAAAALDAMRDVAAGYSTLEYDLAGGGRGSRYAHCRELLTHLTGAADALVVNNNAAALVLALNTVARGREAVISRGELVEIGGAFRVPDVMMRSGAVLREVGATNRTHADDYRAVLSERTGAILKVHPSNFTMAGYTAEATVQELAAVAGPAGVPLIHDVGSGLLLPAGRLGLPPEPRPQESLAAGADLCTFSGDKLLGGPQCGIVVGSASLVERMRTNPLCRALRVDKLTLAALAATLRLYLDPEHAVARIPVLQMLALSAAELAGRARDLASRLAEAGVTVRTLAGHSAVGGGAAPGATLPTTLVVVEPQGCAAAELERRLRHGEPPVIARILDDALVLDPRTVPPAATAALVAAVVRAADVRPGHALP
jgi:L-seryl-tRNA(Ser) seleniumtransferase